ncbi:hypothetical protein PVK06_034104 [Gossypium arboreum]|uniref:Uncharacterized protein n=1 Tax=Gossypium arboreum TaxID=29729 RepID=A0ABR0ND77_GOSAR|nr:hypothetical protein PVK06_034104 [Gossypium arboreum]
MAIPYFFMQIEKFVRNSFVLASRYQSLPFLMANDGVTTRLQKEISQLQQEFTQLKLDLDTKIDTKFQSFHDMIKGKIRTEIRTGLQALFEQYMGQPTQISVVSTSKAIPVEVSLDKGKGY